MAQNKLDQYLQSQIEELRLFTNDIEVPRVFKMDKSTLDEQENNASVGPQEHIISGRIFPTANIFKEGAFQIEIKVPRRYPFDPPTVHFITPIYHPSVENNGKFQHELLDKSFNWTTETSLVDIAKAIVQRIDETDTYHSKNYEVIEEYEKNRTAFNCKALAMVKSHALPRN